MTAIIAPAPVSRVRRGASIWRLGWRNLWRNRRRTWLTAGSIAFAVWLLVFAISTQNGSFTVMIDNAARLGIGHVQLQHPAFNDDPAIEYRLPDAAALAGRVRRLEHVAAVLPRLVGFTLASAGERSFGAQVTGVDPALETAAASLPAMVSDGRYLRRPGEAVLGTLLARNLGIAVGDEVVMLGTALEGGVAAAVAEMVGTVATGQPELDRSLLHIHLQDFRSGWNLGSEDVHMLVILVDRATHSGMVADSLRSDAWATLEWRDLLPEAAQTIELKRLSTGLFFALMTVVVAFSVVNSFMMTVFERTAEFGMLMALGMRLGDIVRQLCVEAFWLSALGVTIGVLVSLGFVSVLAVTGIPLPADAADMLARYHLPDRMYPTFSSGAAAVATLVMIAGTQVAVLVAALRLRRLRPVEALRAME